MTDGEELTGANLIDGSWSTGDGATFQAVDPRTGEALPPSFVTATLTEIRAACNAAAAAFITLRASSDATRAGVLDGIADGLDAAGDRIIGRAAAETGLDRQRLTGELARTVGQLRMFAALVADGGWRQPVLDSALPDRQPAPRPELRRTLVPVGPVAVFAASNFPLAFSVAGGDTASALAAGCPVVVKAHESHPGTSELVAGVIAAAVSAAGLPAGTFALLHGDGRVVAPDLVNDPDVAAVAFTGSYAGGTAIRALAADRAAPIPVFAEMGSQNPVFVLPAALGEAGDEIAAGLAASVTLGAGQFCTKPGIVFGVDGADWRSFGAAVAAAIDAAPVGPLLNERIATTYSSASAALASDDRIETLGTPERDVPSTGFQVRPRVLRTTLAAFVDDDRLGAEVFGPVTLLVTCPDVDALRDAAASLAGQLTAAVHRRAADDPLAARLVETLTHVAGRVIVDGFPTGVEVAAAMQHGGPFPATTDGRFSSVGPAALARFVRPVCFQNVPPHLLPELAANAFTQVGEPAVRPGAEG